MAPKNSARTNPDYKVLNDLVFRDDFQGQEDEGTVGFESLIYVKKHTIKISSRKNVKLRICFLSKIVAKAVLWHHHVFIRTLLFASRSNSIPTAFEVELTF